AHGLPMTFSGCMRSSGVADRAEQFVEAEVADEAFVRPVATQGDRTLAASLTLMRPAATQEESQAFGGVPVDTPELDRGVARAGVVAPPPQDRVQLFDHLADVPHPRPASPVRRLSDAFPHCVHRLRAWPAEEVGLALEVRTHDAQMAPQEFEALASHRQL